MTETTGSRSGAERDPNVVYALGQSGGESARLLRQADELWPESAALLDRVGLTAGQRAIDLGCGPRGVIELMCERVLPGGTVVGLDADPNHVAMATDLAARLGVSDVEILLGDARRTGLPSDAFDVVHARTLLITVPEPAVVLAEMTRLACPGGWVASLEPDTECVICYPSHPAFDRLCEIFTAAFSRNGADPHMGRRLAELYRHAGLTEVNVEVRAGVYPLGHSRRTIRADLVRAMRTQIVDMDLADEAELDAIDAAVRHHLANPDVVVMPGVNFLVCGRKPAAA
jgi:ubiquinone/menaquinone biosynthesis C-methylase UbiE